MKKFFVVMLVCLLLCVSMPVAGDEIQYEKIDDNYEYLEDQIDKIQIDKDIVRILSTRELVDIAMEYPFLVDIFLFDDVRTAMSYFSRTSNVFEELFLRADAVDCFLDEYNRLQVNYADIITGKLDFIDSGYVKEVFLQRYFASVSNRMTTGELELLGVVLDEKYEGKVGVCEDFLTSRQYIFDAIELYGRIPNEIARSTEGWAATSSATYTPGFTSSGSVLTRNGVQYYIGLYGKYNATAYCLKHKSGELSSTEIDNTNNALLNRHSSWVLVFPGTAKYNCHSYAWIQNSSSNTFWLDNPTAFFSSTSFRHVGSNCSAIANDRAVITQYNGAITHSVIVYSSSLMTYSKCGSAGVFYAHLSDMVLEYGNEYEVYRAK